jgi:hypothetical protein
MMLDNDDFLAVRIIQEACTLVDDPTSPIEYMKHHERDIRNVGSAFERLGLAKQDTKAGLGWRPTTRLLDLIVKKVVRQSLKPSKNQAVPEDSFFLESILDAVPGEGELHRHQVAYYAFHVLASLGLLRESYDGDWKTTRQLRELLFEANDERMEDLARHEGQS